MAGKAPKKEQVEISEIRQARDRICVVGTSPLIFNRKTEQMRESTLLPPRKKNTAEKANTARHDPVAEFRASIYRFDDEASPTLLGLPSPAFKAAICAAAVDIPGAAKAQVGRLTTVSGYLTPIFGVPKLLMSDVKVGGISKAPDIRTRAICEEWACALDIAYVTPNLNQKNVANLVAAAGITIGVGDFRQEKGKGSYGLFRVTSPDDPDWIRLTATAGRDAQTAAMLKAECYNAETFDLLSWFLGEAKQRNFKVTQPDVDAEASAQ